VAAVNGGERRQRRQELAAARAQVEHGRGGPHPFADELAQVPGRGALDIAAIEHAEVPPSNGVSVASRIRCSKSNGGKVVTRGSVGGAHALTDADGIAVGPRTLVRLVAAGQDVHADAGRHVLELFGKASTAAEFERDGRRLPRPRGGARGLSVRPTWST
jgi:hypothetical protein